MWVKLNAFDYNSIIETIMREKGFDDVPKDLTIGNLKNIFETVIKIKKHRDNVQSVYSEMAEILLGLSVGHFQEDPDGDGADREMAFIKGLQDAVYDPNWKEGPYSEVITLFVDDYVQAPDGALDIEPEEMMLIMSKIDQYIYGEGNEFDLSDVLIERELSSMLSVEEWKYQIKVYDIPGASVKYRDLLITFPLIILEVEEKNGYQ